MRVTTVTSIPLKEKRPNDTAGTSNNRIMRQIINQITIFKRTFNTQLGEPEIESSKDWGYF